MLLKQHPDCCTVVDVARMLGCSRRNVRHYHDKIKHQTIDGMTLYNRQSAMQVAAVYSRNPNAVNRLGVVGRNVERLQRICEVYYRTQYDVAPPDMLKLAKRLAGI